MMDSVRSAGVAVAALFAGYGIVKYARGKWRRFDLALALTIALGIAGASIYPQFANVLTSTLRLSNRLLAVLVFSNLMLFGLFLYLLNQVRLNNRRSGEIVRAIARRTYHDRYFVKRKPLPAHAPHHDHHGKLLIIIPAYNEQDALRGVLVKVPNEILGYRSRRSSLWTGPQTRPRRWRWSIFPSPRTSSTEVRATRSELGSRSHRSSTPTSW
ncbi:MAG: DUF2304 family protein [Chloroflexia bacterium]